VSKKSNKSAIGRGKALTQLQREMIIQAYALCGNKSQVSREMGCSASTVNNVIRDAQLDRSLQQARTGALEDVAGKLHGKTTEIMDSITPEDMESGLIKKHDDDGKLISVKAYGPSLLQKVTSVAILTDKLKVVEDTKQALIGDTSQDPLSMPAPENVQQALKQLGVKIKSLRMIDIQFDRNNAEVAQKVQDIAAAAELNKNVDEADYEDLQPIDFDNP